MQIQIVCGFEGISFKWPGGSVGQSAALSRRRSRVRTPFGSLTINNCIFMGSQLSWESICLTSRGSQVRALLVPYADVAQLAEQLICNQQVIGSSPIIGLHESAFGWIPEWPKGADCKSVGTAFGGSNPPPPIHLCVNYYRGVEQSGSSSGS